MREGEKERGREGVRGRRGLVACGRALRQREARRKGWRLIALNRPVLQVVGFTATRRKGAAKTSGFREHDDFSFVFQTSFHDLQLDGS